jgi:WhiB family transcriptional regulator, redox-sensing transcriptional regulator
VPHSTTTSRTTGTEWMLDAACTNQPHLDYFDTECGLEAALNVCATCPVGDACLQYAIEHRMTEGIWGGAWGDELFRIIYSGRSRGRGWDA